MLCLSNGFCRRLFAVHSRNLPGTSSTTAPTGCPCPEPWPQTCPDKACHNNEPTADTPEFRAAPAATQDRSAHQPKSRQRRRTSPTAQPSANWCLLFVLSVLSISSVDFSPQPATTTHAGSSANSHWLGLTGVIFATDGAAGSSQPLAHLRQQGCKLLLRRLDRRCCSPLLDGLPSFCEHVDGGRALPNDLGIMSAFLTALHVDAESCQGGRLWAMG